VVDLSEPEDVVAARVREACLSSGFFYGTAHARACSVCQALL